MRLPDYILLAVVALCAAWAWRTWRRALKRGGCCSGGCGGSCADCAARCSKEK